MYNSADSFFTTTAYKWVQSLSIGIFLYLFLIAFLPFGVSNYNPQHEYTPGFLLELGIFGGFALVVSVFNEFVLKRVLPSRITMKYVWLWWLWSILFIGLSLFLVYNILGEWHDWKILSAV